MSSAASRSGAFPSAGDDAGALRRFLADFGVAPPAGATEAARLVTLRQVVRAFSRLPYENLTKIIKYDACPNPESARRGAEEILSDHQSFGAGGTCFSLTALLLSLARGLGFRAEPLLADRRYGDDTHSALLVWFDEQPHLLDPGYLILDPLPLGPLSRGVDSSFRGEGQRIATVFNELVLIPRQNDRLELHTVQGGQQTYRLTFKTGPADAGAFLNAWDASFGWDMMRYPLLTRVSSQRQLYLQGDRFQVRTDHGVERDRVSRDDLPDHVARTFGLAPELAKRALRVLDRQGERHGQTVRP